ncbi:TolB family protein [Vibrio quintilis]|uniref:Translocation protein TolB n=1 Tax=Vibrio quintilis TaxID=1117707 RepID=A0A1M7YSU6_9VIBR|nr:hypothetical protein [Vibrio quintilis]SHO55688.1 hypothetical protein VQ7734_01434 [Vibrio quintilis]
MKRLLLSTMILASVHAYATMDLTDGKTEKEFELYGATTNSQMEFNNAYKYSHFATYSGKYVVFQSSNKHNYDDEGTWGHYVKNTLDNSVSRIPAPEGMDETKFNRMKIRSMTSNGRFLVLDGDGYKGKLMYLYDLKTGKAEVINRDINGNLPDSVIVSYKIAVSEDGKYVYYGYNGPALETSTSSYDYLYLWDVTNNTRTKINYDIDGNLTNFKLSYGPTQRIISGDGRYLIYKAIADVIPGMENNHRYYQIYVYDRITKKSKLISIDPKTGKTIDASFPSISIDGKYAVFSTVTNRVLKVDLSHDTNVQDIDMQYDGKKLTTCNYPTVSENGTSIAFRCQKQAYYYDAVEQTMHQASISQVDGKVSKDRVIDPTVLDNGSGMYWRSQNGHLLEGEPTAYPDSQIYLYRQKPGTMESHICYSDDY